jgi:hypothetical protein
MKMTNIMSELEVIGSYPTIDGTAGTPVYNTPITPRENYLRHFSGKELPLWTPGTTDIVTLSPRSFADNVARATVTDTVPLTLDEIGGPDICGIVWTYVPSAGGSMVVPGAPAVKDINSWEKSVRIVDVDALDWAGESEKLKPLYSTGRANLTTIYTGFFERLISFLDFEGAAIALVDEDQQEGVHRLFDRLCGVYDQLMYNFRKYLNIDIISFHDDWGSQRAPFFSLNTCREILVPYLKRVADSCHKYGMIFDFHSCGLNEVLVPAMIEAGVDIWSGQNLNNWEGLAEKYGDQIMFNVGWNKFDPQAMTEDGFVKEAVEAWERYSKYDSILLFPSRRYLPYISEACFQEIYRRSRERYSEKQARLL